MWAPALTHSVPETTLLGNESSGWDCDGGGGGLIANLPGLSRI